MGRPDIRIDRVIRVTIWNHQTVSLVVEDGRLYIVRTGALAAAATGSVLSEGATLIAGFAFGGRGNDGPADEALGYLGENAAVAAGGKLEGALTKAADKDARKQEARISQEPLEKLAIGWMGANLALTAITAANVSETRTLRVDGVVPQLEIKAGSQSITLRFPQTPRQVVEGLAAHLRKPG